jgi:hypothetical protein
MTRTEMTRDGRSEGDMLRLCGSLLNSGRCLDPHDEDDEERISDLGDEGIEVPADGSVWILRRTWNGHSAGSIVVIEPSDPRTMCVVYRR